MCALVNPRYEAIIEDTRGMIGTHIFGGNHNILPGTHSYLGPSQDSEKIALISALIPNIPILHVDGVTLYENLFIALDDSYAVSCYSYNKNKWLLDVPLVTTNPITALSSNTERELIKIIPCSDNSDDSIIWFVYSDYIITYNANTHEWITDIDNDSYHLVNFNVLETLPGRFIKAIQYDYKYELFFILDNINKVSLYDINNATFIPYSELLEQPGDSLSNIKQFIILNSYSEDGFTLELLFYNDNEVEIFRYTHGTGFKRIKRFDYSLDTSTIATIIKLNDDKRIYIIFDNQRIIELSSYLYSPYEFKKKVNTDTEVITGNISYCNLNETAVYATSNHKLHMLHPIYNIKDRISTLELPLEDYISEDALIKRYTEHFIQESSILLFSNSYYAIMAYHESLKRPLSKRT
jgi:hypothetical protein